VVWLDLCRPTAGDFDMINEEFGLHELAVEDAEGESQRPKLDRYATQNLVVPTGGPPRRRRTAGAAATTPTC
jgi:Mg2+ and Co2+ transporter CorA